MIDINFDWDSTWFHITQFVIVSNLSVVVPVTIFCMIHDSSSAWNICAVVIHGEAKVESVCYLMFRFLKEVWNSIRLFFVS